MAKKSNTTAILSGSSAVKLDSDFNKFWSLKVDLNSDMKKQRADIFAKIKNRIENGFPHSGVALDKVLLQGSALQRTSTDPQKGDDKYDADILVVMEPGNNTTGNLKYLDSLFAVLYSEYKEKIRKGSRTLTIDYSDDLSIDLVPCVEKNGEKYICDKNGNFLKTDGDGFRDWVNEKDSFVGGGNLRKTIQLLKYLRDEKDNFVVKSAVVTVLLGHHIHNKGKTPEKTSKFTNLTDTFRILIDRLDRCLQGQDKHLVNKVPITRNPACRSEQFGSSWEFRHYKSFKDRIHDYNETVQKAYRLGCEQGGYDQSLTQWRKLFGPQFGDIS